MVRIVFNDEWNTFKMYIFSLQVEETITDNEILLDNGHHGTCDSMNSEMDRSETIFGIKEGLESGISKMGNVQVSLLL